VKYYQRQMAIIFALITPLLLSSCSKDIDSNHTTIESETISINTLDELTTLFTKLDYTSTNWNKAERNIPRISIDGISKSWSTDSAKLPVQTKKTIFFRLMTPLSLIANENILRERQTVTSASLDNNELLIIAVKYRVIKDLKTPLTESLRKQLLNRVDIIPVSLALAQSAEESGWGTSRFAAEGNAFFGQWDFSGKGMKPKQQREALGNYGVARFDSPLESVEAYMLNINTNAAYTKLRSLRVKMHSDDNKITGYQLTTTLDKYSERGEAYVQGLQHLIRYNKLETTDSVKLSDDKWIHLKILN